MDVEFCDLSYVVRNHGRKATQTTILKALSGRFKSGELSAIMGPSGAGKSTLLNAVSGYKSVGVKGLLKVNGQIRDESTFHKSSCYITQEDLLQPLLSVEEVMLFAANLKLSIHTSCDKKKAVVDTILNDLGLFDHRTTRTERLSGGQKKRLSIALELINNPPVFFLDEPTSGLDNVSTTYCVKLLHKLSRQGKTIVCTIHQPSATLFQMFDQVYVIAKGQCVYQGSTTALVPFLSSAGLECPTHYNPADYIIELTDGDQPQVIPLLRDTIGNGKLNKCSPTILENALAILPYGKQNEKIYETTTVSEKYSLQRFSSQTIDYPTCQWIQFYIILRRMMVQVFRNKTGIKVQFVHYLMCGLAIGTMFYNNANDGTQMFNHLKFCVGVILFFAYTQLMIPVLIFPSEVKLVKKEYFNRWYAITPYYAALTVSKLPIQITLNMMFLALVYFMTGLPVELGRFALFSLIGNLVSFVAEGMGLAIGSIFNVTNGCAVGPALVAPFLGLAIYGFDFAKEIPWIMAALMKLSFMRCGIVALVLTVFGYNRQPLKCPDIYCHFDQPTVLLNYLDIAHISVWQEIFAIVGLLLFFRTICYVSLRWRFVT